VQKQGSVSLPHTHINTPLFIVKEGENMKAKAIKIIIDIIIDIIINK
jgi:hypothetical protein